MSNLRFETDRAGFPMIWVDSIESYIYWLPATKVEFEIFMCDPSNGKFDDKWYEEDILSLNERVAARKAGKNDYWKLFLTGIYPSEIQDFSDWLSQDGQYSFSIPTEEEWLKAYKTLKKIDAEVDILPYLAKLPERIQILYKRMDEIMRSAYQKAGSKYTLANQMLMKEGVMEWVKIKEDQWGGMGMPATQLYPAAFDFEITGMSNHPRDPEKNRFRHYGFRLLRS